MPIYKNILSNAKSLWRQTERSVQGLLKGTRGNQLTHEKFIEGLELDRKISETLYDSTDALYRQVREDAIKPVSESVNVIGRQSGSRVPGSRIKRGSIGEEASSYAQSHGDAFSSVTTGAIPEEATEIAEDAVEAVSRPANVIKRPSGSRVPGRQMQSSSINGQASTYSQSHGDAFTTVSSAPIEAAEETVVSEAANAPGYVGQLNSNKGWTRSRQRGPVRGGRISPSTRDISNPPSANKSVTFASQTDTGPIDALEEIKGSKRTSEPIVNADVTATAPQASAPPPPPPPQAQVPPANKPYAADASTAGTVTAPATVAANAEKGTTLPAVAQEKAKGTAPDTSQSDEVVSNSSWARSATMVMGGVLGGAALTAALSSNRGQQTNAQLYGQQPLY